MVMTYRVSQCCGHKTEKCHFFFFLAARSRLKYKLQLRRPMHTHHPSRSARLYRLSSGAEVANALIILLDNLVKASATNVVKACETTNAVASFKSDI